MLEELKEIGDIISKSKSFFLTTHINADGDGIGSILGLGMSLEKSHFFTKFELFFTFFK